VRIVLGVVAWALLAAWPHVVGAGPPEFTTFLSDNAGFTAAEIATVERDSVVKTVDRDSSDQEIAVIGVVHVDASRDQVVEAFRDIRGWLASDTFVDADTLGDPPSVDDVAAVRFMPVDREAIQGCEVYACKIKLPERAIERFRAIDWSSAGADDQAAQLVRRGLLAYVQSYSREGNRALVEYVDKEEPWRLEAGFEKLLGQASYTYRHIPELHRYMKEYPRAELDGAEDFLYWSVLNFGYRPVTSLTHATIYRREGASAPEVVLAQKQIYANHYYAARLELTAVVDDPAAVDGKGVYLVYLDRALYDEKLGWAMRRLAVRGTLKHTETWLSALRARLEN